MVQSNGSPNPRNFCGGNFQDWLEVNLLEKCNGLCSWCVEKTGYHPKKHVPWWSIAHKALSSGRKNIILLGGEPTLYPKLRELVLALSLARRNVWITTNGSMLSPEFIKANLVGVTGVNISIHDFDLEQNRKIVGVDLTLLPETTSALHALGINIRFNCNCIANHVDTEEKINQYIVWAKGIGADKIRFAELKDDEGSFVDLAKTLDYKYGLSDDPFICGCNSDAVIHGLPVNFRQMCGLQTPRRKKPVNPRQYPKPVLYYDGKFYAGWQKLPKKEMIKTWREK
jgi:organic radical activating enzyme